MHRTPPGAPRGDEEAPISHGQRLKGRESMFASHTLKITEESGGAPSGGGASMLLGCGSASHTRGALVLASSGSGAASGTRVCSGAGSERAAQRRGSGPGPGTRHGAAEGQRRWGLRAAAAAAGRRVPGPAERSGEAAGALPRHLQLYQGVHHLRGLFLGAQGRAGRHQLPEPGKWNVLRNQGPNVFPSAFLAAAIAEF